MRTFEPAYRGLRTALEQVVAARDLLREAHYFKDPPTPEEVEDLCGLATEISEVAEEVWRELAYQFEHGRIKHEHEGKKEARP